MKYSREKLIELAKPYFTKDINTMYATEDGHYFHEGSLNYAKDYADPLKIGIEKILIEDIKPSKKKDIQIVDINLDEKDELIEYAKSLGLKVDKRMGIEKIESLIKDKENARE